MTEYAVPAIIGILVSLVLGIFITPVLSVIIGSFIAGILCKGGAGVGIVMGMLYAVPVYLFAGIVASAVPVLGVVLGGFVGGMRE